MNVTATERPRPLRSYWNVIVPWNEESGGVTAYLADEVDFAPSGGWLVLLADGWLWSKAPGASNERDYFERPKRMAIPRERVLEVYWPEEDDDA